MNTVFALANQVPTAQPPSSQQKLFSEAGHIAASTTYGARLRKDRQPQRWRTGRALGTRGITSVVTLAAEIGGQHLGIVRDLPGFTGKPDPPGLEHMGIIRDLEGETCILLH